ncbi:MAG: hypothetical protein Tsb009_13950 [Planctomycetaceae bacterium]
MRSPFEVFRKNQKILMVVLIGLSMFAFIILDSLTQLSEVPKSLMVLLLAMLLGFVFWVFGTQAGKGKQREYALGGAILGAAVGMLWMVFNRPVAAVETTAGNLSEKQLQKMSQDHQKALEFMERAYVAAMGQEPSLSPQTLQLKRQLPQFAQQILQMDPNAQAAQLWRVGLIRAKFDGTGTERDDVIEKYLLLKEADELGIEVNEEAVNAFLNKVTNDKLSKNAYLTIRRELQLSSSELNELLASELKAMLARRLLMPRPFRTPGQFWNQYRKLNVKQHLESAAIPVSDFIDKVPEPTEKELRAFFDKYKGNFPSSIPSPEPAFGQPQKIKVAYFSGDYEAAEKHVLKELENQYLDKQEIADELKRIDEKIAEVEKQIAEGKVPKGQEEKERANARRIYLRRLLTSGRKVPRFEFEIVKHYEDTKAVSHANPAWAPPLPDTVGKEGKNPFPPNGTDSTTPKTKTETDQKAKPFPPKSSSKTEKKSGGAKTPAKKTTEKKQSSLPGSLNSDLAFTSTVALQPKTSAKKPAGTTAKAKKPVSGKPSTPEKTKPTQPKQKLVVEQPPAPPLPEAAPPKPFLPLDSTLKQTIRDQLLEQKTKAEISKRLDEAAKLMSKLADQYLSSLEEGGEPFDKSKAASLLRAEAEQLELKYQETDWLTELEFQDATSIPFVNAPVLNMGGRIRIEQRLFSTNRVTTVQQRRLFQVLRTSEHVVWKTDHADATIPKFDDEGIKEQVEMAWKQFQARKFAKQRAEELAKLVREKGLPMDTVLDRKTVTGDEKSRAIKTHSTKTRALTGDLSRFNISRKFSWMIDREQPLSSAPNAQPRRIPPRLSTIPGLNDKKIGPKFMKTIFEELEDGDVGVAHNEDESIYYVVRVFERTPGSKSGRQYHMSQLLKDNLFSRDPTSIYTQIRTIPDPRLIVRKQLWKKYEVIIRERKPSNEQQSPQ